jgi:antitoxin component of MazEF toxin-antitoxin module
MVMRVQHIDGEYRVVLTPEAIAALHLTEGSEVEVSAVGTLPSETKRYASDAEVLQAFRETLPQHAQAYRELAK